MIDPTLTAAFVAAGVAFARDVVSWVRSKLSRSTTDAKAEVTELRRKVETLEAEHRRKVEVLEKALDDKEEANVELRSQRDRLQITADLMDKFLSELPPLRRRKNGSEHD